MKNILKITLTGCDDHCHIDELKQLLSLHEHVELGFLLSNSKKTKSNRYPSLNFIESAFAALSGRVALHVCGGDARQELAQGHLSELTKHAPRVQVNGIVSEEELKHLAGMVGTVITQHNAGGILGRGSNNHLLNVDIANHQILIDSSGGRGILPTYWPHVTSHKALGRAGGLGVDNLADQLRLFEGVAEKGAWVDMEGKLRDDIDWFDCKKAEKCTKLFLDWSTN
jgi:hypothetical protein